MFRRLTDATECLLRTVAGYMFALLAGLIGCVLVATIGPKRMWVYLLPKWARGTLKLVDVSLRIKGLENLTGPAIFCSNHVSLLDIIVIPAIVPPTTHIVAKRELLYVPLLGWAFASSGGVLVDRRKPQQAVANLRAGCKNLPKGWSLIIFPEGTRSATATMRPFKRGAFHLAKITGLPLVPIGIDGTQEVSPPNSWLVRPGEVRVCVGTPIDVGAWQSSEVGERTQQLRQAVEACVGEAAAMAPTVNLQGGRPAA